MSNTTKTPETSLCIYKSIYFTNCTQKTAIAVVTTMKKNIFCSTVGGWYKELKVKDFLKSIFCKKKVKVHVFEVPLSFCVFDYSRKICKRKQQFTLAINKTTEILVFRIHFQKMKK